MSKLEVEASQPGAAIPVPWWVFAAVFYIKTRAGGAWLLGICLASTLYCLPWSQFLNANSRIAWLFLAPDWSWFAIMVPMTLWYWLAVRWMNRNNAWQRQAQGASAEQAAHLRRHHRHHVERRLG